MPNEVTVHFLSCSYPKIQPRAPDPKCLFARAGKTDHLITRELLHPARGRPRKGTLITQKGRRQEEVSPNGEKPREGREALLEVLGYLEKSSSNGQTPLSLILKVIRSHLREWSV